jgi:glycosyltransferase involved in cell wall biosynthesis
MAEAMRRIANDSKQRSKLGELGFSAIQDVYNKNKTASAWIKLVEGLHS